MKNIPLENASPLHYFTTSPLHLLPLHLPPKLVLLPLKALMFKESFAEGDSALWLLEKSSAETGAGLYTHVVATATFTGWSGNLIKVIL